MNLPSKDAAEKMVKRLRANERDDDPMGMCHLYRNGQEQYSAQTSEQLCSASCDQMNQEDQNGNWTFAWNPIA